MSMDSCLWQATMSPRGSDETHEVACHLSDLLSHGDTGIACATGSGSEVVLLNGVAYAAGPDGVAAPLPGSTSLSWGVTAALDHYAPVFLASELKERASLVAALETRHDVEGSFGLSHLVSATGTFVDVRVACDTDEPASALAAGPTVLTFDSVEATVVGVSIPTRSGAGEWHLHLVSQGRRIAGHLLGFGLANLACQTCTFEDLCIHTPNPLMHAGGDGSWEDGERFQ
jgi:acetolactate decarboxylase